MADIEDKTIFLTYTGNIINLLDTGAIQIVEGQRTPQMGGMWQLVNTKYSVYLFYSSSDRVIEKELEQSLAIGLDWVKINSQIEKYWRDNKISSEQIEKDDIILLLTAIGVAVMNGNMVQFNDEFIYKSQVNDTIVPYIDIMPIVIQEEE